MWIYLLYTYIGFNFVVGIITGIQENNREYKLQQRIKMNNERCLRYSRY
jgi:hypothetical protein